MKILQLVDVPWDSGLAHYALVVAQGLKKDGHQVFVSAVPGQKPWMKARRLGLKTVPLATLKGLQPLRRFLKEHKIELINAHTGSTHSLAVASALGQNIAVVRTRADARQVKAKVGSWFLYKNTQRVIAAADYIRQAYIKTFDIPNKKVMTVYQGVSLDDFEAEKLPAEPILGIVARLDPVKGHRYLMEALWLLKDAHPKARLRIIGQEENIKQKELRTMAARLHIADQVSFEGYCADVPAAMAGCSIGVIASTGSEAVSRVALEWMAAGRPVVATRVGCLPEMVKEGSTGFLVEPKNAPALARALGQLLHNPAQAQTMGKAGRQRAEKLFGIPRFVEQTLAAYEGALSEIRKS